jgi:hypothetical protein
MLFVLTAFILTLFSINLVFSVAMQVAYMSSDSKILYVSKIL